jgi:hypothetical protein
MRLSAIVASSAVIVVIPSVVLVIGRKRSHLERAGAVRVDPGRRADPVLPHQRAEARQQR